MMNRTEADNVLRIRNQLFELSDRAMQIVGLSLEHIHHGSAEAKPQ